MRPNTATLFALALGTAALPGLAGAAELTVYTALEADLLPVYEKSFTAAHPDIKINWVWMPPWGPNMITEEGREMLQALGFAV